MSDVAIGLIVPILFLVLGIFVGAAYEHVRAANSECTKAKREFEREYQEAKDRIRQRREKGL